MMTLTTKPFMRYQAVHNVYGSWIEDTHQKKDEAGYYPRLYPSDAARLLNIYNGGIAGQFVELVIRHWRRWQNALADRATKAKRRSETR